MDSGPILVQAAFKVDPDDHAEDVENKIMLAIDRALDSWVPTLVKGELVSTHQDEAKASYTGIRRPADGLIDWEDHCQVTYSRIRAASHPHPGAYTYYKDRKLLVWRAKPAPEMPWRGVPGRVLMVCNTRGVLVQAGEGLMWLTHLEYDDSPRTPVTISVGHNWDM